jgi:hypothetical protein
MSTNTNQLRVFKEKPSRDRYTNTSHLWAVERVRTGHIVAVYRSQREATFAAHRMARMSTGFGLAV